MPELNPRDLASWSGGVWEPAEPARIDGVSNDTRTIGPGMLYVALKGERFDGHDFVGSAFAKGASAALVARDYAGTSGGPLLRVADTGDALRRIAQGYASQVGPELVVITGSAGKSTAKEMIAQILARQFATAWTRGNWNNDIGLPLSLLVMEPGTRIGVFEVGTNHPGEIAGLCRLVKPTWGVITNVGPVHIEFFGTEQAIAEEKGMVLRALPRHGTAVLNRDDKFFDYWRSITPCHVVAVSLAGDADYVCRERGDVRVVVEECRTGERVAFRPSVPGAHNVTNAMMAIAVARGHGVPWDTIRAGLEGFRQLPMRWEECLADEVRLINDAYNANPVSMRAALNTFAELPCPGRRWVVLSGMLELGEHEAAEHAALGAFAAAGPWHGVVTVGRLGALIADAARAAGLDAGRLFPCSSNEVAADLLRRELRGGDAVLFKASRGMRLEEIVQRLAHKGG